MRLRGFIAVRVGQHIALGLIHQDERIEHHVTSLLLQPPDRLNNRNVGRGASVDRAIFNMNDLPARRAGLARNAPGHAFPFSPGFFVFRTQRTAAAAQVIAEPGHNQRNGLAVGQLFRQRAG